jgi:hypothetical protein
VTAGLRTLSSDTTRPVLDWSARHERRRVLDSTHDRVDIAAAATRLGITPDGVRKRIKRGQLGAYQVDGRTYVVLDGQTDRHDNPNGHDSTRHDSRQDNATATEPDRQLLARLEDEVRFLRGELERKDTIIMMLAQRPALPAPERHKESLQAPEPAVCSKTEQASVFAANNRPRWLRWWPWGRR